MGNSYPEEANLSFTHLHRRRRAESLTI